MKSRRSLKHLLLVAMVAAMPAAISAVSLRVNTAGCMDADDDPFTNVNITISCGNNKNNSSKCLFGDVASISGTVQAIRSFDNSAMTYKACVWKYCPQSTIRSAGSLCDDWLSPMEDQTCGDPGLYSITLTEMIPETDDIGNSLSWLVTLNFGVNETSCNQTDTRAATTEDSPSYSSTSSERSKSGGGQRLQGGEGGSFISYSLMGAIFGIAFGTVLAARKRCNEPEDYDDDELFEEKPFSFTELKDFACNA